MQISALTVHLMLLILPGAIATIIVESLTTHKKREPFRFILYSFILGLFSYATLQLLLYIYALLPKQPLVTLSFWSEIQDNKKSTSIAEIFYACIAAIPTGLAVSYLIQHSILNRFTTCIRITNKYGDDNLYSYFLNREEVDWVWVRDTKQGITYGGKVYYYSETDYMKEIVLSDVKVYRSEDTELIRETPSIYLSFAPNDVIIELPLVEGNLSNEPENKKE